MSDETVDEDLDELEEDDATQDETEIVEDASAIKRKIFTDKSDPPISSLYDRFQSGDLVLDPSFQRRKVWDDVQSSRLIESLLLAVPLPVFYLAEGPNGEEEVIDGQQRLTAFFRFLGSEFPLRGLKVLRDLNGHDFKALDKANQRLALSYDCRGLSTGRRKLCTSHGGSKDPYRSRDEPRLVRSVAERTELGDTLWPLLLLPRHACRPTRRPGQPASRRR